MEKRVVVIVMLITLLFSLSLTEARNLEDPIVLGDEILVFTDGGENIPKNKTEPVVKDRELSELESRTLYQPPTKKLNSLEEFKNKYGEPWKVRWDEKHGTVESINVANYDIGSELNTEEDVDEVSRDILKDSKALLDIDNINNLQIRDIYNTTINNRVFWTIKYYRTYGGVLIYRGYIGLGFRDTYLTGIDSRYYPVSVPTTTPKISKEQALNISIDSYGAGQSEIYKNSTELIILPFEVFNENSTESYLTWKVSINILSPLISDNVYVDAITGNILYKQNRLVSTSELNKDTIHSNKSYISLIVRSLFLTIFLIITIILIKRRENEK